MFAVFLELSLGKPLAFNWYVLLVLDKSKIKFPRHAPLFHYWRRGVKYLKIIRLKTPNVDIVITKSNLVFMKMEMMVYYLGNWATLLFSSVHWTVTVYIQGNFAGNKIFFQ